MFTSFTIQARLRQEEHAKRNRKEEERNMIRKSLLSGVGLCSFFLAYTTYASTYSLLASGTKSRTVSLLSLQQDMTQCVGKLIIYGYEQGYRFTLGDAYRDPRVHGEFGEKLSYSSAYSVHKERLAVDLNLFVDGKYVSDGSHPAYADLGLFWEHCHSEARWGGRFGDANHFSFEYRGFK